MRFQLPWTQKWKCRNNWTSIQTYNVGSQWLGDTQLHYPRMWRLAMIAETEPKLASVIAFFLSTPVICTPISSKLLLTLPRLLNVNTSSLHSYLSCEKCAVCLQNNVFAGMFLKRKHNTEIDNPDKQSHLNCISSFCVYFVLLLLFCHLLWSYLGVLLTICNISLACRWFLCDMGSLWRGCNGSRPSSASSW